MHRRPKKTTTEDCRRFEAMDVTHERVTIHTHNGGSRVLGRCPRCDRPTRFLYQPPGQDVACRKCHNLTYTSTQAEHGPRGDLLKTPALLRVAVAGVSKYLDEGRTDEGLLMDSLKFIGAANELPARSVPAITAAPEVIPPGAALHLPDDASLQERVTVSDVVKTTRLMERLESIIESDRENHINRAGEVSEVPLRVDSLAKLGHVWAALSNLRATRAGLVTEIYEQRGGGKEKGQSLNEIMRASLKNHDPEYARLCEIEEGRALPVAE